MNFEIQYENLTFFIVVHNYYKGCPAKTYGPPESCYEAEADEIDWCCVAVKEELEDGTIREAVVDIDRYSAYIEKQLLEVVREVADDDYPEPDYFDCWRE